MTKLLFIAGVAGSLAFTMALERPANADTPDFPMWCQGTADMASTSESNVIVDFAAADGPAGDGLQPGQCSWLDRALQTNEPTRIVEHVGSPAEARNIAQRIDNGETWTFWVFNVGRFFHGTAQVHGTQSHKPVAFDSDN